MLIDDAPALQDAPAQTLRIGGYVLDVGSPGFAEVVAEAYAAHRRPRCLCRPGGIEMYIARLNDGYVVKRMPETGNHHAPECPSFELPAELTGLAGLLGGAIVENPVTGETKLRLDFPLSKGPGRAAGQRTPSAGGSVTTRSSRLSLRGLLHYLWDQAELTHWRPGFEGKRSWATVRRHLLRAAELKTACGNPLQARLYVPEVFAVEQKDENNARRRMSWSQAAVQPGRPQQVMLVIAEVKGIVPAHRGWKVVMKHAPDVAFAIDDALHQSMDRAFGQELDLWSASEDIHMVMAATFSLSSAGTPVIGRLCLMPVTRQWLPVETVFEQQLVERLIREQRGFRKILRYGAGRDQNLACVVLTDCGAPASIHLTDDGANQYESQMRSVLAKDAVI